MNVKGITPDLFLGSAPLCRNWCVDTGIFLALSKVLRRVAVKIT